MGAYPDPRWLASVTPTMREELERCYVVGFGHGAMAGGLLAGAFFGALVLCYLLTTAVP